MAFLGAEAIMDEVESVLKAGYAAAVTTVNAAYSDGIAIAAPASTSYHRIFDPADQNELTAYEYPLVVISPGPEDAEGPRFGDEYTVTVPVEVAVVVDFATPAEQQKQLLRHMRVVKSILAPETSLTCGSVAYQGGGFARKWTTDSGVVRDVAVVFTVTVHESP